MYFPVFGLKMIAIRNHFGSTDALHFVLFKLWKHYA